MPREATPPSGAGLITRFLPFDRASLEESVTHFLDRLNDYGMSGEDQADEISNWYLLVTAAVAIEATRRYRRQRAASGTWDLEKRWGTALSGLS
jgi:hypothetical protein